MPQSSLYQEMLKQNTWYLHLLLWLGTSQNQVPKLTDNNKYQQHFFARLRYTMVHHMLFWGLALSDQDFQMQNTVLETFEKEQNDPLLHNMNPNLVAF